MAVNKESKEDKEERERLELEKERRLLFGNSPPAKMPLTARGTSKENEELITKFREQTEPKRDMTIIPLNFPKKEEERKPIKNPYEMAVPG